MCHVPWVCRKLRFSTKAKVFLFRFVFCLLAVDFLLHLLSLYTQRDCRPISGRLRWGNLRKSHFFFQRLVKVVVILKLHNLDQGERNRMALLGISAICWVRFCFIGFSVPGNAAKCWSTFTRRFRLAELGFCLKQAPGRLLQFPPELILSVLSHFYNIAGAAEGWCTLR